MAKEIIQYTPQPVPRDEWLREKPAPLLLITVVEAIHKKMMHTLGKQEKDDYLRFYDSYHNSHAIEGTWYADRCRAAIILQDFASEDGDVIIPAAKLNDIIKASEKVARAHNVGQKQRLALAKAAMNGHAAAEPAAEVGPSEDVPIGFR